MTDTTTYERKICENDVMESLLICLERCRPASTSDNKAPKSIGGFGGMGSLEVEQLKHGSLRPHILMVALPFHGHYYQFAQLLHICANYEGVTVTVVCTEGRISELSILQDQGEFHGIDLRLEPLFGPPVLYPQDPIFPLRAALEAAHHKKEFEPFAQKILNLKKKGLPGVPTCVMSDMLLSFPEELASQLGVPWYSVYVASPPYSVQCLQAPKLLKEGLHPYESPRRNEVLDIPSLTFARVRDLPHETLEFPEYSHYNSEKMSRAAGLIYNSAEELDAPAGALKAIRYETGLLARAANREGPKVLAIGPILNFPGFTGSPNGCEIKQGTSSPCLEFLSSHSRSSVLYISFGSAGNCSPESVTELAHGLEASGVPFLWVLKSVHALAGAALPPGFEGRTKGRGYIETGWAPQAQILLHPSIGGFLSHCGWNSVLESLCAGVPVITWPLSADQPLNARFIENVSKSGVSVKPDFTPGDEKLLRPSRDDVSRAVRILMVEQEGKGFRKNAEEWKTVLNASVGKGGSSYKALRQLMDEILLRSEGKANE